ncbi:MAG: sulfatase [Actinomycetota bacterium]|nr:sulfatase [Actinomycetota bacterium]
MGVVSDPARRGLRVSTLVAGLAMLQWAVFAADATPEAAHAQTAGRPNIVLIVTDDQRYDTLHVMPEVQRLLVRRGMSLRRAIVTNPLCCPSRATILTGRYSHTTGVYTNGAPNGGWTVFQPSEPNTIATALQDVGYRTALIGKYLNGYGGATPYVPPGWDKWLAIHGGGGYFNYSMYDHVRGLVNYGSRPSDYSTDVIRRHAVSFILNAPEDRPLFMMVTPFAPHGFPIAAPRHDGDLASAPVRLSPAVNEADVSDKPAYIASRGTVSDGSVRTRTRNHWETLLAVDEMVSRILEVLAATGRAGNTLFIFTSDNGVANREHRWTGKQVPYEGSIRVPLVMRLPGVVPPNTVSVALVSNVDVAPTIADFAGASLPADGVSLRPMLAGTASSARSSVVLEHVESIPAVPTYCGVRTQSFTFAHYATGEEELYDLSKDPRQLQNVALTRRSKTVQMRALTESLCRPVPPGFSW